MAEQFVTNVTPNDVLFGRGSGPNDHEGNVKFRETVSGRKDEYMSTNHRQTKAAIAKDVVDSVFLNQGRFLKKLEAAELEKFGFPTSADIYQIVDNDTVMEKAKQALRQNRDKRAPSPKRVTSPKHATSIVPGASEVSLPNFTGSLEAHEVLEPLLIATNPLQSTEQAGKPKEIPAYARYTSQLDGMPNPGNSSSDAMRRGPRRASMQSMSSRRDSLQMSELMYRDGDGMSTMMESFRGMSTTGGDWNTSADSIGTIDNMFSDGTHQLMGMENVSNMSLSSVFNDKGGKPEHRMSIKSSRDDGVWSFDESSPMASGGGNLWTLEEQRNSLSMQPPASRTLASEQIAASLMQEPLAESISGVMMSTTDFPIGVSTGSLMMTSMDTISPQEEEDDDNDNAG